MPHLEVGQNSAFCTDCCQPQNCGSCARLHLEEALQAQSSACQFVAVPCPNHSSRTSLGLCSLPCATPHASMAGREGLGTRRAPALKGASSYLLASMCPYKGCCKKLRAFGCGYIPRLRRLKDDLNQRLCLQSCFLKALRLKEAWDPEGMTLKRFSCRWIKLHHGFPVLPARSMHSCDRIKKQFGSCLRSTAARTGRVKVYGI